MQANTPKIEIAGHRDADTGEIDLVVYVDGEQQNVLWNIFDGTRWANFSTCLRDEEDRVPRSAWRGAVREVASQGSVAFASMISAYSEIDEETLTYDDMHPSANVQRDAATVEDLDPELWFEAANASTGTTGFSAAYGVVALRAFRTCAAESEREKVEAALSAYRAATRYFRASLANTLQGLFADLRHFADSRELRIEARPHHTDAIACAIGELLYALKECGITVWAEELTGEKDVPWRSGLAKDVFAELQSAAYRRYVEEVVSES